VNDVLRLITLFAFLALPAWAQTNIDLGGLTVDSSAQIEVSADSLTVDQDTGFTFIRRICKRELR
jgi:lipopolysaccharide export system protein LptA